MLRFLSISVLATLVSAVAYGQDFTIQPGQSIRVSDSVSVTCQAENPRPTYLCSHQTSHFGAQNERIHSVLRLNREQQRYVLVRSFCDRRFHPNAQCVDTPFPHEDALAFLPRCRAGSNH